MRRLLLIIFLFLLAMPVARATELVVVPELKAEQSRVSIGGSYLYGVISPPDSYNEVAGTNSAKLYEQYIRYARGIGDGFLKDGYVEMESLTFQSGQETVNGSVVHPSNNGWVMNARTGGNFVHTQNFTLGVWIHGGTPTIMDKSKFVNPVVDYAGLGLNSTTAFGSVFGMSQSIFVGSGMFWPRTRNPNAQGTMFLTMNLGKRLMLKGGGLGETDLTKRVDAAYQASALGDGTIKHVEVSTPLLFDITFNKEWHVDGGYNIKWLGKSMRGSRFATLNLSRIF